MSERDHLPGLRGLARGLAAGTVVGGSTWYVLLALRGSPWCLLFLLAAIVGWVVIHWTESDTEQGS